MLVVDLNELWLPQGFSALVGVDVPECGVVLSLGVWAWLLRVHSGSF